MKMKQKISNATINLIGTMTVFFFCFTASIVLAGSEEYSISREKSKQSLEIALDLSQDKVLKNGDGTVSVALTIHGASLPVNRGQEAAPVDLVVVLDRSGSMEGQKIFDSQQAILRVMERMGRQDRMAVVSYSNGARLDSPLVYLEPRDKDKLARTVRRIEPGGGTNLGAGLQYGIENFLYDRGRNRQRKVILVSDGLANQGITSLYELGRMAEQSGEQNFTISTVGVGYDFNEVLMTTIADHGAGNYYFLENPRAFARIFEKEFNEAREVVASSIEIRIPVQPGVRLIDAGGYPLKRENGYVVIRPGDVLSGQERKLFLTYDIDTSREERYPLDKIDIQYSNNGVRYGLFSENVLHVNCVTDERAVISSIDRTVWAEKVVTSDYNKLKSHVAQAVKEGKKGDALAMIEEYESSKAQLNARIGSKKVADNLEQDVEELKQNVTNTFSGSAADVVEKQKVQSKLLQYDSYRTLRNKK